MSAARATTVVLTVANPNTVWVNDTWQEQADTSGGGAGIQVGDTVMTNGGAGDDVAVTGKIFGYNAFNTVQDGINAVSAAGTVNVLAGNYLENPTVNKGGLLCWVANAGNAGSATRTFNEATIRTVGAFQNAVFPSVPRMSTSAALCSTAMIPALPAARWPVARMPMSATVSAPPARLIT